MRVLCLLIMFIAPCIKVFSAPFVISENDIDKVEEKYVGKIIYSMPVTWVSVYDLIKAIEEMNNNYKNLEKIYLYINSDGGDINAAYAAYQAIKSSPKPITTVNLGAVISAATMIYCGSQERLTFQNSYFYLHAPKYYLKEANTPRDIATSQSMLDNAIAKLEETYSGCVNLDDVDKAALYSSEDERLIMDASQAKQRALVTSIAAKGLEASKVTFFIEENQPK